MKIENIEETRRGERSENFSGFVSFKLKKFMQNSEEEISKISISRATCLTTKKKVIKIQNFRHKPKQKQEEVFNSQHVDDDNKHSQECSSAVNTTKKLFSS